MVRASLISILKRQSRSEATEEGYTGETIVYSIEGNTNLFVSVNCTASTPLLKSTLKFTKMARVV